jgi:hypothetical protein
VEVKTMRTAKSIAILSLFISVSFGAVAAQAAANIEGMPLHAGDTAEKVREVYKTEKQPEPYKSATEENTTQLRLKTRGVWFFFDMDGKIYTIRLDAPFAGAINGVKIGDTREKMFEVLGQPIRTLKPLTEAGPYSYIYYLDDDTTANFTADADGKIETVFLGK